MQTSTPVFPITEVIAKDTFTYNEYVAEIHAVQNVEMRAKVNGYLENIYIDEGQPVREGQVLFSINQKEYQQELSKAKANHKSAVADARSAELEYRNVHKLVNKNIISGSELERAQNKLASANAKVEEATAFEASAAHKMQYTSVRAPFNGIVNKIPYKIGSLIEEGTLLTSISQNNEVFAYFDVSEKEYLTYAYNTLKDPNESKAVSLVLADGSEFTDQGKIETIEGEIDQTTGNIAFRARFNNPDKILKHGASGKVRLLKKLKNVILVPQKSTFEIQDKLYVYVLAADNKVYVRNIVSSQSIEHLFVVSKGLKPGEKIVYEGVQNVTDGLAIEPRFVHMRQIVNELALR